MKTEITTLNINNEVYRINDVLIHRTDNYLAVVWGFVESALGWLFYDEYTKTYVKDINNFRKIRPEEDLEYSCRAMYCQCPFTYSPSQVVDLHNAMLCREFDIHKYTISDYRPSGIKGYDLNLTTEYLYETIVNCFKLKNQNNMKNNVLIIDGKEIEIPQSMIDEIKGKLKKKEYHTFRFYGDDRVRDEDGVPVAYIGRNLVDGDFMTKVLLIDDDLKEVNPSFVGASEHFRAFIKVK